MSWERPAEAAALPSRDLIDDHNAHGNDLRPLSEESRQASPGSGRDITAATGDERIEAKAELATQTRMKLGHKNHRLATR